jgi:hypothetical protein
MKKQRSPQTKTFAPVRTDENPGPDSAGQSGDTQGLSDIADADSESVRELLEEGQSFEAEAVMGVENVPDADVSEIHLKQVREDDVPQEYLDQDKER